MALEGADRFDSLPDPLDERPLLRGMFRLTMGAPAEITRFAQVLEEHLRNGGTA